MFIATAATIIASQAVISGAFSLTQQAIQLGFIPRMEIHHTSASAAGQIYIPAINWGLMVMVILLVLFFQSSSNLAAAYGIAVTGAMFIDTLLLAAVLLAGAAVAAAPQARVQVNAGAITAAGFPATLGEYGFFRDGARQIPASHHDADVCPALPCAHRST